MAWKTIKGWIKFYFKSSQSQCFCLSSPCISIIKMCSLWSCKNAAIKRWIRYHRKEKKSWHLHCELPLNALHGVLFWCPLLRETFLTQLCLKFRQMSTKNIYLLLKIQLCHCLTDSNIYLFVLWYILVLAQSAWLCFHCFSKF